MFLRRINTWNLFVILLLMNSFSEFNQKDSPISIGRHVSSTVHFPSSSMSRKQCKFEFKEGKWFITDGTGIADSKNGTWLEIKNRYELANGLTIKAGQIIFRISII